MPRLVLIVLMMLSLGVQAAEEQVLVRGAGPSTKIAELFFQHFTQLPEAKGYRFEVEPTSIKHEGGVRAAESALFGRTGRPLNEQERSQGKYEILLARMPAAIVTGSATGVKKLSIGDLARIYGRKVKNWKQLGGNDQPILLVGREPSEVVYGEIKRHHAFMREVTFDKVFAKDHEVVEFIQSPQGANAIAFGSRENFPSDYLVSMLGFTAGIDVGLVYDQVNVGHPLVLAARKYASSEEWRRVLRKQSLNPSLTSLP